MKFYTAILFFVLFIITQANGQAFQFQPYAGVEVQTFGGIPLKYPWVGGLLTPQFQEFDINGDGIEDLLVMERVDNTLMPFIRTIENGTSKLTYAPDYAYFFPPVRDWFVVVDFNGDGLKDLFTGSNGGTQVYENISRHGRIAFRSRTSYLDAMWDFGFRAGILIMNIDLPGIADMDGDGDIDIMSFDNFDIGKINYYRNMSMERYGHADSLDFLVTTRCWGLFEENQFNSDIMIGLAPNCFMPVPLPNISARVQHLGSTITPINANKDSLMDVLIGDIEASHLSYLINNGSRDTARITQVISDFPSYDTSVRVPVFPAAYLVDVDYDGRKDMVVAPSEYYEATLQNHVWYYRNESTTAQDSFSLVKKTFLVDDILQYYTNAAPLSIDVDGDGLADLLVAYENKAYFGVLHYYRNTGVAGNPNFQLIDTSFLRLDTLEIRYARLAGGDLDGDGLSDLLIGNQDGPLLHYKNISSGGSVGFNLQSTDFQQLAMPPHTAPELIDIDRDGKLDLLVGARDGTIAYWRNTGTAASPQFSLVHATFGNVRVTNFFSGFAVPRVADFNGNGAYDLAVGTENGRIYFYPDFENNLNGTFTKENIAFFFSASGVYDSTRHGYYTTPTVAYLDSDTLPDLLIGSFRGGIQAFRNTQTNVSVRPMALSVPELKVWPNPSGDGWLKLALDAGTEGHLTEVRVFDIQGRLLGTHQLDPFQEVHSMHTQARGVLLIQLQLSDGRQTYRRVIVGL